jgi:hypothetical protein
MQPRHPHLSHGFVAAERYAPISDRDHRIQTPAVAAEAALEWPS